MNEKLPIKIYEECILHRLREKKKTDDRILTSALWEIKLDEQDCSIISVDQKHTIFITVKSTWCSVLVKVNNGNYFSRENITDKFLSENKEKIQKSVGLIENKEIAAADEKAEQGSLFSG